MNLFTQGQVARMTTVLLNSPRRATLLTSPGLNDPTPVSIDLALRDIVAPSPVTCNDSPSPVLLIQNSGNETITSFKVNYRINYGSILTATFTGLNMASGAFVEAVLPAISLAEGESTLLVELVEPNGLTDLNPDNNFGQKVIVVNNQTDILPFRETFENPPDNRWTIINPSGGMPWQYTTIHSTKALYFNAFNNFVLGDEAWFVSPILDLRTVSQARMFFDIAYALRDGKQEGLRILASSDCGETFDKVLFNTGAATLANGKVSAASWSPTTSTDWVRRSVSLSEPDDNLLGNQFVRIAFVVTNANGNNLYLDNIEFFLSDNPLQAAISEGFSVYPNPAKRDQVSILFNLNNRQPVTLELIDAQGKIVSQESLINVLNQTFPLALYDRPAGLYLLRAKTSNAVFVKRFIVVE